MPSDWSCPSGYFSVRASSFAFSGGVSIVGVVAGGGSTLVDGAGVGPQALVMQTTRPRIDRFKRNIAVSLRLRTGTLDQINELPFHIAAANAYSNAGG